MLVAVIAVAGVLVQPPQATRLFDVEASDLVHRGVRV